MKSDGEVWTCKPSVNENSGEIASAEMRTMRLEPLVPGVHAHVEYRPVVVLPLENWSLRSVSRGEYPLQEAVTSLKLNLGKYEMVGVKIRGGPC